ncbi:hypothetical protein MLD38_005745 [Melastoma candidum]|uniref:Uncharacterized protein n=1 Tax=Melastoma candidum TaxID=119954 RepID=A0ACB9RLV0_9MYRT|nr:hypothetical protein MLD38_005745 [Melastoma candidum]
MGSFGHGVSGGDRRGGASGVDKGVDFAQYFCTYAYLYHQKEMLSDRVRMDAYYNSVFKNKKHFQGKVRPFGRFYSENSLSFSSGCWSNFDVSRCGGFFFSWGVDCA